MDQRASLCKANSVEIQAALLLEKIKTTTTALDSNLLLYVTPLSGTRCWCGAWWCRTTPGGAVSSCYTSMTAAVQSGSWARPRWGQTFFAFIPILTWSCLSSSRPVFDVWWISGLPSGQLLQCCISTGLCVNMLNTRVHPTEVTLWSRGASSSQQEDVFLRQTKCELQKNKYCSTV